MTVRRVSAFCSIQSTETARETSWDCFVNRARTSTKMKNSQYVSWWVLGFVLVFQVSKTLAGTEVPVLIWGGDQPNSGDGLVDPFEKTSQDELERIITNFVGGSLTPILVFVRDDLCVEDLTKHKDTLAPLMDTGSLIYRPIVDGPISVFENLPYYNCTLEEEIESVSEGQLVLTKFTDLDGIVKTFNMMKDSSPKLIAALTGKSCRYSNMNRMKRAASTPEPSPAPKENEFVINTTRILLYASTTPNLTVSDEKDSIIAEYVKATQEGDGTHESPLTLNFEYTVAKGTPGYTANVLLQFPVKTYQYYTPEALYKRDDNNVTLRVKDDLSFPYNFSYHCSQSVVFSNTFVNTTFIRFSLTDFQVQIDANNFADAYDCVGFTSIPIWAGIFVTSILAIIMTWGLTMVMNIRTPDRYDDSKGKTITISATAE